jgi:hypothetical protein
VIGKQKASLASSCIGQETLRSFKRGWHLMLRLLFYIVIGAGSITAG